MKKIYKNHIQHELTKKALLIGLRGSGKSTLAPLLADSIGVPSLDLDTLTLDRLGASTVAQAWTQLGEPAFRKAEVVALRDTLRGPSAIIAAGGGAPTAPGAEELIRDHCAQGVLFVVYLRCEPSILRQRLSHSARNDPDRPSLTGADPLDEIEAIFAARDPLYQSLAQATLDASRSRKNVIAAALQSAKQFFA